MKLKRSSENKKNARDDFFLQNNIKTESSYDHHYMIKFIFTSTLYAKYECENVVKKWAGSGYLFQKQVC